MSHVMRKARLAMTALLAGAQQRDAWCSPPQPQLSFAFAALP